jgi:hypothetical protein
MFTLTRFRRPSAPETATVADDPTRTALADDPTTTTVADDPTTDGGSGVTWVASALAGLLVLFALDAPHRLGDLTPGGFVRIPLEGLVAVALLLVLPSWARRVGAVLVGLTLGLLTVLKLLDIGFYYAWDRPFDLTIDWTLLDDSVSFLSDSIGRAGAIGAAVAVVVLVAGLLVLMTLSVLRLSRLVVRHHITAVRAVAALTVVWLACAAFGVRLVPGVPVADHSASALVTAHASGVRASQRDRETFAAQLASDAFRDIPGQELLTGLRGKDVIVSFVESYGRDAVEDPEFAPQVGAVLDAGNRRLRAAGFASRSAFLTSPTTGGGSWLAHDTLLSGLWIDGEQRHRALLTSDRLTLNGAFHRAGWQTVGVMPAATQPWPEGRFFGYDRYYDADRLAYRGPKFSYAPMPDQFTLAQFERLEHGKPDHAPLMAEIPLISSHSPWAAIPKPIAWTAVGDGSIYHDPSAADPGPKDVVGRSTTEVRTGYRRSIEYSLDSLISYVETYGDDDLVLVFLGDHQPAPVVTGEGASRDVPITVVAHDPAVLDRISGWGWQDGLRPGPSAPVWRMDSFRDRFLTAFGGPVRHG